MSHSVTVTRTTTTTTSAIIVNTGYLKSFPGLLKVFEVILASVCLGIICYYGHSTRIRFLPVEFFMSVSTAVLVGSFCLLLSCIITLSTAAIISKTIYVSTHKLFFNSHINNKSQISNLYPSHDIIKILYARNITQIK
ncbi:hypothetical protein AAG570_000486 [Ranatra chinensis]|uniref:NADH dehydrogenase subunit 4L n=1 Tax=Ranatra chinensis TaxID=642074 RepID=A0ABD0YXW9_9HEMI